MQIAVCDDEENVRNYICKLIEKQKLECEITEFASGEELLRYEKNHKNLRIDILFLDIAMKDMDGMAVAKQLRKIQAERQQGAWGSLPLLIFITEYSQYMLDTFSVHAFQFIVKPIKENDFADIFSQAVREYRYMEEADKKAAREITVGNGIREQSIKADDIYYIESGNHKVSLCLRKRKIEYYGRIRDLEEELQSDFFRIHKGYLVNLKYIDHYNRTDVYMKNGDRLMISKYKYQEFVKAYLKYISED